MAGSYRLHWTIIDKHNDKWEAEMVWRESYRWRQSRDSLLIVSTSIKSGKRNFDDIQLGKFLRLVIKLGCAFNSELSS